jgi:hypothetical protein
MPSEWPAVFSIMNRRIARWGRAILHDVRAAVVALVVLGLVSLAAPVVRHNHVNLRAWVAVFIGLLIVLIVIGLHERSARLAGALDRAETEAATAIRAAEAATSTPQPNADAQQLVRHIDALRTTLTRRTAPFRSGTYQVAASDEEVGRYEYIRHRVEAVLDIDQGNVLQRIWVLQTSPHGEFPIDQLLSGLDQMQVEVEDWGHLNPASDATN